MEDSGRRLKVKRSLEDVYEWEEKIGKKQKRKKYILLGRYIILMSRIGK